MRRWSLGALLGCAVVVAGCGCGRRSSPQEAPTEPSISREPAPAAPAAPTASVASSATAAPSSTVVNDPDRCIDDLLLDDDVTCFHFRQGYYWCRGYADHARVGDANDRSLGNDIMWFHGLPAPYLQVAFASVSCGLRPDRTLACWGDNVQGLIRPHDALEEPQYVHKALPMPAFGTGIDAISTGPGEVCVLRGGEVYCALRGQDEAGTWGVEKVQSVPPGVRSVGNGRLYGCAATADRVYCWGWPQWARGDGRADVHTDEWGGGVDSLVAAPVEGPELDLAELDVGLNSGAALTKDGRVFVFGPTEHGEWGNGRARACRERPCPDLDLRRLHEVPSFGTPVRKLAVLRDGICALTEDGSVWCWGSNQSQIAARTGHAPKPGENILRPRRAADLGTDNVRLLNGDEHLCVEKRDGSYRCWGSNSWYQLASILPGQPSTAGDDTHGLAPFTLEFPAPRCKGPAP